MQDTNFNGHYITIHWLINDIFMVLFFGIAAKEVTESCLPGGSLNPPRKALAPLVATAGGVIGPVSVYIILCQLLWSAGSFNGYTSSVPVSAAGLSGGSSSGSLGSSSGSLGSSSSSSGRMLLDVRAGALGHITTTGTGGLAAYEDAHGMLMLGGEAAAAAAASAVAATVSDGVDRLRKLAASASGSAAAAASGSGAGAVPTVEVPLTIGEVRFGWGVPTATDISLAWVVAMQVFPIGHPAIDFLLLLAVADDAIGLVIIATVYTDPLHPVDPVWMLLLLAALAISFCLRRFLGAQHWAWYVLLGGAPAWIGLAKASLHPALALCFVVPMMPSAPPRDKPNQLPTLHAFEHVRTAPNSSFPATP